MRPPRRQRLRPHPPPSEISRARRGGRGLTRLTRRARAECGCRMPEPARGRAREGRGRGPSPLLPASVPLAPSFRPAVLDLRLSGVYSIETTYLGACQLRHPWRSVNITQRQEPALPARRCTEGRRWRSCWCGGPVEMQTPVAGAHPSEPSQRPANRTLGRPAPLTSLVQHATLSVQRPLFPAASPGQCVGPL